MRSNFETALPSSDSGMEGFFRVVFKRNLLKNNQSTASADRLPIDTDRLPIEIGDRTAAIMNYLNENGNARGADFAKLLGLGPDRVRQILQALVKSGIIIKHGDRRHTYYTANQGKEKVDNHQLV